MPSTAPEKYGQVVLGRIRLQCIMEVGSPTLVPTP